MTIRETRVMQAAIKWWKGMRPCSFSEKKHLENPTINTTKKTEKMLALAVADYLKNKKG